MLSTTIFTLSTLAAFASAAALPTPQKTDVNYSDVPAGCESQCDGVVSASLSCPIDGLANTFANSEYTNCVCPQLGYDAYPCVSCVQTYRSDAGRGDILLLLQTCGLA